MRQAHAVKIVYNDGIIEDVRSAVIIAETQEGMTYEAMNILPDKQLLVIAMAFHSMLVEMDIDDEEFILPNEVLKFIKALMNPIDVNQTKTKVELQ